MDNNFSHFIHNELYGSLFSFSQNISIVFDRSSSGFFAYMYIGETFVHKFTLKKNSETNTPVNFVSNKLPNCLQKSSWNHFIFLKTIHLETRNNRLELKWSFTYKLNSELQLTKTLIYHPVCKQYIGWNIFTWTSHRRIYTVDKINRN